MPDDGLGVSDDRVGGILGPGGLWMSRTSGILFFTICSLHISGIFRDVFLSNKIFLSFRMMAVFLLLLKLCSFSGSQLLFLAGE